MFISNSLLKFIELILTNPDLPGTQETRKLNHYQILFPLKQDSKIAIDAHDGKRSD